MEEPHVQHPVADLHYRALNQGGIGAHLSEDVQIVEEEEVFNKHVEDPGPHRMGAAEEVGEVIPEVVAYEEDGQDAKSVDYARLVAVLIEATKGY